MRRGVRGSSWNLGRVPTFQNTAWSPARGPSVPPFRQADVQGHDSAGIPSLGAQGIVMDFTLLHLYK